MAKTAQEWADLFGAKLIGKVPDVGGGPFGMARLAHIMHERLTPGQGERPGRPTDPTWQNRPKVPMSELTHRQLVEIAKKMSTADRQVSPMQVAAQLLETAVNEIGAAEQVCAAEAGHDAEDIAAEPNATKEELKKRKHGHRRRS